VKLSINYGCKSLSITLENLYLLPLKISGIFYENLFYYPLHNWKVTVYHHRGKTLIVSGGKDFADCLPPNKAYTSATSSPNPGGTAAESSLFTLENVGVCTSAAVPLVKFLRKENLCYKYSSTKDAQKRSIKLSQGGL
jgi:hypothetical protein